MILRCIFLIKKFFWCYIFFSLTLFHFILGLRARCFWRSDGDHETFPIDRDTAFDGGDGVVGLADDASAASPFDDKA